MGQAAGPRRHGATAAGRRGTLPTAAAGYFLAAGAAAAARRLDGGGAHGRLLRLPSDASAICAPAGPSESVLCLAAGGREGGGGWGG